MPRRAPVDLDSLVDRACELARSHRAVPRAQMKSFRPHLAALAPRLAERGLEVGAAIRIPLETQLLELADKGFVPLKGLDRKLGGATARDAKLAVDALVARGQLVSVVRDAGVGVALPAIARLDPSEVQALLVATTKLLKLLKSAARAKKGVLREDMPTWLKSPTASAPPDDRADLVQEILRRLRGATTPTHVPALLRSLGLDALSGRRVLLDGVARGLFELEPESGMGRLSREDADLCPPGPMGTRLSWIRARTHQGARS